MITEKLDGGNCCMFAGKVFARTHKHEATHASFGPIKQLYVRMRDEELLLPSDSHLALFGETMCAQHSIHYDGLTSYFYLFAVFDTRARTWLAWQVHTI
jgi:hypothetical protein